MDTVFYQLLTSRQVTLVNMVIGAVAFVLLLILLFGKNSRDERGRKIIGKASIAALIGCAFSATVLSHYMQQLAEPHGGILMIGADRDRRYPRFEAQRMSDRSRRSF